MTLEVFDETFSVCKTADFSRLSPDSSLFFTGKTDEEYSLVCETRLVPDNVLTQDDGWSAFRIRGILDFSLIGILAKIASLLAENGISIFAVSTFNTDYILTKDRDRALSVLEDAGYRIERAGSCRFSQS